MKNPSWINCDNTKVPDTLIHNHRAGMILGNSIEGTTTTIIVAGMTGMRIIDPGQDITTTAWSQTGITITTQYDEIEPEAAAAPEADTVIIIDICSIN